MKSKTTLYLPEAQHRRLKSLAGRRGTTISSLLSEGAELVLERYGRLDDHEELRSRARAAAEELRRGLYEGPSMASRADDILYRGARVAESSADEEP